MESYIIPWGRYWALAYYSPTGYKMLRLTKGVYLYMCVFLATSSPTRFAPKHHPRGWCDDNHVKGRIGLRRRNGQPSSSSRRWVSPRVGYWGPCRWWLSSFSLFLGFCLQHWRQWRSRMTPLVLHSRLERCKQKTFDVCGYQWVLEVAWKVATLRPCWQLPPMGPSAGLYCHAGRRTPGEMLLCLCLLVVLGS